MARCLAVAIGAIALIALVAVVRSRRGTPAGAGPPTAPASAALRIAVLPFENIGDSSDAYFADGVADAVRGKLAELRSLEVIARGSSVPYAGTKARPADVARDLGVRYLLTGTVRWAKQADGVSRVLVAPELVAMRANAAPATEWSERFDAPLTDVFRVQADIAGRVAQALGLRLGVAEAQQLAARPTTDIVAYDAYLRAEAFTRRFESGDMPVTDSAIKYYREAVGRDSNFARAWAKLAGAQSVNFINSGRPAGGAAPIHAILARVDAWRPTLRRPPTSARRWRTTWTPTRRRRSLPAAPPWHGFPETRRSSSSPACFSSRSAGSTPRWHMRSEDWSWIPSRPRW